jgi:hypothetical protein
MLLNPRKNSSTATHQQTGFVVGQEAELALLQSGHTADTWGFALRGEQCWWFLCRESTLFVLGDANPTNKSLRSPILEFPGFGWFQRLVQKGQNPPCFKLFQTPGEQLPRAVVVLLGRRGTFGGLA